MSGSRQSRRVLTPWLSETAPPPTRKKSWAQASVIFACTLKSAESCWLTTILRPLMPPASLHHLLKTSAVSNSSWSRPGRPEKPGSANVPTLISVGVTPWAVAPDASPFWQTSFRVPKSPDAALDEPAVVDDVEDADPVGESLRPHAASTSVAPTRTTIQRLGTIVSPNPLAAVGRRGIVATPNPTAAFAPLGRSVQRRRGRAASARAGG